jgi:putative addiction module killer protein
VKEYILEIYKTKNGKEPFIKWLKSIKDKKVSLQIRNRLRRMELGNFGDSKSLKAGLYEARFFISSGYRIYYSFKNNKIILLLAGGDKSSQTKDIKFAKELLNEVKND